MDELIDDPGAKSDKRGETFEKEETKESLFVEPTLTDEDTQAGNARFPVHPSFPEATVVAIPAARRLSIWEVIRGSSSSQVEANIPPPRLRLAAAMGNWVRIS
jgi:hypothetical protein